MDKATVEQVGEVQAGLGEGPVWDAARDRLIWIDIRLKRLYETNIASGETTHRDLPDAPGCVTLTETSDLLLAMGQDLVTLSEEGDLRPVASLPTGSTGRFNDGKPDAMGRFWIGTATAEGAWDCGLWRFAAGQGFAEMAPGVSMSNGLGWSPDGSRMYYVDSMTHRVDVFDYDATTGAVSGRTPWVTLPEGQLPDGLYVDAQGCVWLAVWGQSTVICIAPDGTEAGRIAMPTPLITSCAFGGADYGTLFVTTAREDDTDPQAGRLFAVETGAKGVPPNRVRLAH
jgi:sugar lactone lactonase YvrE